MIKLDISATNAETKNAANEQLHDQDFAMYKYSAYITHL